MRVEMVSVLAVRQTKMNDLSIGLRVIAVCCFSVLTDLDLILFLNPLKHITNFTVFF
jgi:hypothetical protein